MPALKRVVQALGIALFALLAAQVSAQSYGTQVTLDAAKKIAAASVVEAKRNNWNVAIAIVDNHGFLIYYEMMDDTQTASATVAIEKSRTAAMWRRPSKALEDATNKGRVSLLSLPNVLIDGGLPIVMGGKIIGGVGVSGMASPEDAQVAKAGLEGLK